MRFFVEFSTAGFSTVGWPGKKSSCKRKKKKKTYQKKKRHRKSIYKVFLYGYKLIGWCRLLQVKLKKKKYLNLIINARKFFFLYTSCRRQSSITRYKYFNINIIFYNKKKYYFYIKKIIFIYIKFTLFLN